MPNAFNFAASPFDCLNPASRYRLGSRFRTDGHPVAG